MKPLYFLQGYKTAHQMLEVEKANLLGLLPQNTSHLDAAESSKVKVQSPLERMQQFFAMRPRKLLSYFRKCWT